MIDVFWVDVFCDNDNGIVWCVEVVIKCDGCIFVEGFDFVLLVDDGGVVWVIDE